MLLTAGKTPPVAASVVYHGSLLTPADIEAINAPINFQQSDPALDRQLNTELYKQVGWVGGSQRLLQDASPQRGYDYWVCVLCPDHEGVHFLWGHTTHLGSQKDCLPLLRHPLRVLSLSAQALRGLTVRSWGPTHGPCCLVATPNATSPPPPPSAQTPPAPAAPPHHSPHSPPDTLHYVSTPRPLPCSHTTCSCCPTPPPPHTHTG